MLDTVLYCATAPIRWFGRSRAFRSASSARSRSAARSTRRCGRSTASCRRRSKAVAGAGQTAAAADLPPVTRASYVIAPVAVALTAIRASLDAAAPRELIGQNANPVSSLLSKADIGITVARGPLTVNGAPNDLAIGAPLNSLAQDHRPDRRRRRQRHRLAHQLHRQRAGQEHRQPHQQGARPARRRARPGDRAFAPRHHLRLAAGAEPHRAACARRQRGQRRRHEDQHGERGAAADRQDGQRAGRRAGVAAAPRYLPRALRARAVDQDVPRHPARRRPDRPAATVAGDAPDPRRRRAAAHRRARRHAHRRRAGGNAHHADRDQAELPVPGQARAGAADGRRQARGRLADRRAVHRAQQAARGAAQGPPLSGGRQDGDGYRGAQGPMSAPPATGC